MPIPTETAQEAKSPLNQSKEDPETIEKELAKSQKSQVDPQDALVAEEEELDQEAMKKLEEAKNTQIFSAFNLQKFMMEFMGSFAIIFFGNWAQIFSDLGMSNQIAVSLVIGLFMTVFTWIGTDISGAHFNPITTVSVFY